MAGSSVYAHDMGWGGIEEKKIGLRDAMTLSRVGAGQCGDGVAGGGCAIIGAGAAMSAGGSSKEAEETLQDAIIAEKVSKG